MKKIILIGMLILFISISNALVIEKGTIINYDCNNSCNVTYYLENNITVSSLSVYEYGIILGQDNISIIPVENGNVSINITSWLTTSNNFSILGENEITSFIIKRSNTHLTINYNGSTFLSPSNITLSNTDLNFYYYIDSSLINVDTDRAFNQNIISGISAFEILIGMGILSLILVIAFGAAFSINNQNNYNLQIQKESMGAIIGVIIAIIIAIILMIFIGLVGGKLQ